MDRADVTAQVTAAKRREGLSWTDLGDRAGADRVWLTAALLGQHPVPPELARKLGDVLGLTEEAVAILQEIPTRGSFETLPPTDPTIYRLYEVLQVYGPALKALIHEDFGDGIMSAINFNLALERGESDAGPRVRITLMREVPSRTNGSHRAFGQAGRQSGVSLRGERGAAIVEWHERADSKSFASHRRRKRAREGDAGRRLASPWVFQVQGWEALNPDLGPGWEAPTWRRGAGEPRSHGGVASSSGRSRK